MIGYFSENAAEAYGSSIYLNQAGKPVEVTTVIDYEDISLANYGWDDKVFVGHVTKFLHQGRQGRTGLAA